MIIKQILIIMIAFTSIQCLPLVNIVNDGEQSNNTDNSVPKANSPNSQSGEFLPTNKPSVLLKQNADSDKLHEPAYNATDHDQRKPPNRRSTSAKDGMLSSLPTVSVKSEQNGNAPLHYAAQGSSTVKPTVAAITTTTSAPKILSKRELAEAETNHSLAELPDDGQNDSQTISNSETNLNDADADSNNDADSDDNDLSQPTIIECDSNDSTPL